jgi:hypothetical protein
VRYFFGGVPGEEPYALITSCSDVIDLFLYGGPKGEPDAPITAKSEITDLLKRLKLIR